ncbi:calcitonin gene-related peptide type 1 receptor-like [Schistocerca nitens]|uniref:calcitonin gene-related peptide type 1 receptor-like n=1 Tax=Schistocerca nitens TaxID=7011 RepID=UPI0021192198|nr:calcitonin gene-related peptide type 1 receptor-like [Schistocerca nitens]
MVREIVSQSGRQSDGVRQQRAPLAADVATDGSLCSLAGTAAGRRVNHASHRMKVVLAFMDHAVCVNFIPVNDDILRAAGGCPADFDGIACWPPTPPGGVATQACPHYLPDQGEVSRACADNATWESGASVNYTSCGLSEHEMRVSLQAQLIRKAKYQ